MKAPKKILSLFITCFLFIACTKESADSTDPNSNSGGSSPLGTFKVDFDGQTFVASSTQAIVNNTTISITGQKSDGSFIQISLVGSPSVGTYNATNSKQIGLLYSKGSGQNPFVASPSLTSYPNYTEVTELEILSIDTTNKIIKGTFKFNGGQINPNTNQLIVKNFINGEFNVSYKDDVPAPVKNTLFAKLDGADYNPTNTTGIKSNGSISIIGRRGSVENIGLTVPDSVKAGTTINVSPFGSDGRAQYILDSTTAGIYGGTGTITIVSHDTTTKKIVGTFSFNASTILPPTSTKKITLGTFEVTYL